MMLFPRTGRLVTAQFFSCSLVSSPLEWGAPSLFHLTPRLLGSALVPSANGH